jgi:hypothetical protein
MGHSARLRAQQLRRNDADSRAQIRADTASIMGAKASIIISISQSFSGSRLLRIDESASDGYGSCMQQQRRQNDRWKACRGRTWAKTTLVLILSRHQ